MTNLSGRLGSGDTLYGTFLGLGSALAAEACALAGFDWLLTDLEHGGGDELAADAHGSRRSSEAMDLADPAWSDYFAGLLQRLLNRPTQVDLALRRLRPLMQALDDPIIVGTVYDPSDGTGRNARG